MYNYLFYFFYCYYDKPDKWKEMKTSPFFSTVLVLSVLLMFNFLFIRDFITYQLNGIKYEHFRYENLVVPTIFIGFNFWYFKNNNRFKRIIKNYRNSTYNNKTKFYLAWSYMILSIVLLVLMGYSVRNNIKWI